MSSGIRGARERLFSRSGNAGKFFHVNESQLPLLAYGRFHRDALLSDSGADLYQGLWIHSQSLPWKVSQEVKVGLSHTSPELLFLSLLFPSTVQ